ncbi:polysaccharide deacetylase family protein [Fundicoccus culcitae]|uniref:Transcriptional regulator n=1 Tax=Fundicoccus culcitae TaxID=2969821 RepID=A0ABY5P8A6_9LACT|nr:hypothetical protein [Fundicoccus culcitae]UUX34700.1 hypothetical protein NRE15_03350 [Fundicoccus culcitae]
MINTEQLHSDIYLVTIIARVKVADKIDDLFHKAGTSGATTFLAACYDEDDRRSLMAMDGQRKEIIMKVTKRERLDMIINYVQERYPENKEGEGFLLVTPLAGLAGLDGYGDVKDNPSFINPPKEIETPYKMVTVICNHGEGEDYIDATQREDILQHILVRGHGSANFSNKVTGRSVQPEKDIVMQIVKSENVDEIKEFNRVYKAIQFNEAGAICFTRNIAYLYRF